MSILARGTNATTGRWTFNQALNPNGVKPSSLVSGNTNPYANRFVLNFPVSQRIENSVVALESISLFRAWFNILGIYQNNILKYNWNSSSGYTTYTAGVALGDTAIPNGSYEVSDLSNFMQLDMHEQGFYLIYIPGLSPTDAANYGPYPASADDSDGTVTYFLSFLVNPVYYRVTLVSTPIFASETDANAAGYFVPTAFKEQWHSDGWFSGNSPQLVIPATSYPAGNYNTSSLGSMSKVLGFAPGTYPSTNLTVPNSINGQFAPQVSTVNVVNVSCSLINNSGVSRFANVIYSFASNTVGPNAVLQPAVYERSYLPMTDGQYNSVEVDLFDDNLTPLPLNDPDVQITLSYKSLTPGFETSPYAALPGGFDSRQPQTLITDQSKVPVNFGSHASQASFRAKQLNDHLSSSSSIANISSAYDTATGGGVEEEGKHTRKRRQYGRV